MTDEAALPPRLKSRPFYWSFRRELWEHRAIWIAPAIFVAVALVGALLATGHLQGTLAGAARAGGEKDAKLLIAPYALIALAAIVISILTAFFYSNGALHGERRDRSILFWKSLPVSDLTVVLSKAAIPVFATPVATFVLIVVAQTLLLLVQSVATLVTGNSLSVLWSHASPFFMWAVLAIGLPYIGLWLAPVYAWLMLVSAWAKRMPVLWAVGPFLAAALLEAMVTVGNGHMVGEFIGTRLLGGFGEAFSAGGRGNSPIDSWADVDPIRMLSNPNLWIGLVMAAAFLALAVRLRRAADPI